MKSDPGFRDLLARLDVTDFDGHTEFSRLDPDLRLEWLSQAGLFFHSVKRGRPSEGLPKKFEQSDEFSGSN